MHFQLTHSPALQRAEVLAGMAGVGLMLVAVLWTRAVPLNPEAVKLEGDQGLVIAEGLTNELRTELAWGVTISDGHISSVDACVLG